MDFILAIIACFAIESPSDLAGLLWYAFYVVRYSRVVTKFIP